MSQRAAKTSDLKRRAKNELKEIVVITLYFTFVFAAIEGYKMLLLNEFHLKYWNYGFALINALVIAKVVMIGEAVKVGTRYEARPLLISALYKAFLFCLLVLVFHFAEELIKPLVHGIGIAEGFHKIRIDDLLGRAIMVFCTFIPFFAFGEFRRVLGEDKFDALVFRPERDGPALS